MKWFNVYTNWYNINYILFLCNNIFRWVENMNIILVEDNMLKRKMIEVSLIDIKPDARIICFRDLRTAEQFIDRNAEYIDLLVLDWCFFWN